MGVIDMLKSLYGKDTKNSEKEEFKKDMSEIIKNQECTIKFIKKEKATDYTLDTSGSKISVMFAISEILLNYIQENFITLDEIKFLVDYVETREKEL